MQDLKIVVAGDVTVFGDRSVSMATRMYVGFRVEGIGTYSNPPSFCTLLAYTELVGE